MKSESDWTSASRWRDLFELGDQLLREPSHQRQIALVQDFFSHLIGAQAHLRLIGEYEPLPHEKESEQADAVSQADVPPDQQAVIEAVAPAERNHSQVALPLKNSRGAIGEISLEFPQETQLLPECEEFLSNASQYIANILELIRLSSLKDWRLDQLSLVRSVNSAITQIKELGTLYPRIVELVQTTFNYYFVAIYTSDENGKNLFLRAYAGRNLDEKQKADLCPPDGIAPGKGLVGACALHNQEIICRDIREDARYRLVQGLEGTRSEICLPLVMGDQVLGVVEILSDRLNAFHENDLLVLRILSDNIALAISNSSLFNNLLDQTWVSTLLLQVTEAAQQHANVDDLLAAVVRSIPLLIGVQRCAVYLYDNQTAEYLLTAHYGFNAENEAMLAMLPYSDAGKSAFLKCANEKKATSLPIKHIERSAESNKAGDCCGLIPMIAHQNFYGMLLVDRLGKQPFTQAGGGISLEEVFMAVGRQAALAIENMRLNEAQENETYVTTILLQVAEMVAAAADMQECIENIINLLPLVVGVDTVLVYLLDDEKRRFYQHARLSYQWKNELGRLPMSIRYRTYGNLDKLLTSKKPVYFRMGSESIESWLGAEKRHALKASAIYRMTDKLMMVFPLFIMDEPYGLMFIGEAEDGYKYREKKIEIISGIARHLSLSIQNEKLKKEMIKQESFRREIEMAREMQITFLPETLPEIKGWEFSARWRPALQVAGDFYDVFELGDGVVGLVIADVSDKGMPAALFMTVARTLIRAEALEGNPPAETLQRVNRLLLMNSQKGLFVTGLYAILDTNTATLTYTNAGHNQPLLLKKSLAEAVWLEKGGMALGVSEETGLKDCELHLREGDLLMFYTDGVSEAQSADGSFFGEDRLYHLVKQYKGRTSFSLIDIVDAKITEFRGSAPASDDLTMLVLQRAAR